MSNPNRNGYHYARYPELEQSAKGDPIVLTLRELCAAMHLLADRYEEILVAMEEFRNVSSRVQRMEEMLYDFRFEVVREQLRKAG
jgi:hypothetical protein